MKMPSLDHPVTSAWLEVNGRRLDSRPYVSGAVEARVLLQKLAAEKVPLKTMTQAIFNGPRFARTYVDDPAYGVPFMGSTDILAADLSTLPYLSKKQVQANPELLIKEGWTLISCSGTIGRMAYSRTDMRGMAGSQHFMRVVPNPDKILPGYLYAYLSSRFGVSQVVEGTYGAIIQHIEPHHIADLPVPLLDFDLQRRANHLVMQAAILRTEASQALYDQKVSLEEEIGDGPVNWAIKKEHAFAVGGAVCSMVSRRLDAFHYIGYVGEAVKRTTKPLIEMREIANVLRPPIMKRIHVEEGGYEFLGGTELYSLTQKSQDRISAKTPNIHQFIVKPHQVLFQCVGQRYGIFGWPVLANRSLIGKAVTEAVMRIIPNDPEDAGYISIYLATQFGHRFTMRYSAGTSIPVLQEEGARRISIYWPDKARRQEISQVAEQAWENRALATELEVEARRLVEEAIQEGAGVGRDRSDGAAG